MIELEKLCGYSKLIKKLNQALRRKGDVANTMTNVQREDNLIIGLMFESSAT